MQVQHGRRVGNVDIDFGDAGKVVLLRLYREFEPIGDRRHRVAELADGYRRGDCRRSRIGRRHLICAATCQQQYT